MNSKQGSGKRPLQKRNFEIVVNHIDVISPPMKTSCLRFCGRAWWP